MTRSRSPHHLALLLIGLLALALAGCGGDDDDDNPTAPEGPSDPVILVLSDGGTEEHVSAVLAGAGFDVRDGGLFHEFTGDGLADADAVIVLAGPDYGNDMDDAGEMAIVSFVHGGGGLLTTEWLTYSIDRSDYHQILQHVIPVSYAGEYGSESETYTVMENHPVTANLPQTFTTGADGQFSMVEPKAGATQLIRGNSSGHAVVAWTQTGRAIHWNMAGAYGGEDIWTPEMDQLLIDAVGYISDHGQQTITPVPLSRFRVRATNLMVIQDGDAGPNPGDFYITLRLRDASGEEEVELDAVEDVLYQVNDGNTVSVDLELTGLLPAIDGRVMRVRVQYIENDGGGLGPSVGTARTYVYDAAEDCWQSQEGAVCLRSGGQDLESLIMRSLSDGVDAELLYRVIRE